MPETETLGNTEDAEPGHAGWQEDPHHTGKLRWLSSYFHFPFFFFVFYGALGYFSKAGAHGSWRTPPCAL